MMNQLQATTEWIEKSRDLKNVRNRLAIRPNDTRLLRQEQILNKRVKELASMRGN